MVRFLAVVSCVGLCGCDERARPFGPACAPWRSYPFDGMRTWVYRSTDPALDYELVATSDGVPEGPDAEVYRIPFHRRCTQDATDCADGELVQALSWSSGPGDGVAVHAVDAGAGPVDLEPPLAFAGFDACDWGATTTAEINGASWTTTLSERPERCPIAMEGVMWDECFRLDIETTAAEGPPLAGTWWSATAIGVAAFQRAGEAAVWGLLEHDCTGECDGKW